MRWTRCGASIAALGHAIERVFAHVEGHHWIFGFPAVGYIFYQHDRSLHIRCDTREKRIDEIRKRLAAERRRPEAAVRQPGFIGSFRRARCASRFENPDIE